ncbi:hypothetical protein ANDA3_4113 [plant metagenome]
MSATVSDKQALLIQDLECAANELLRETRRVLAGIGYEAQRQQLQQRLAEVLR